MENEKTYAAYPFEDKSGLAVHQACGVDLLAVARENRELAGDLYVYGVSYLEACR